MAAAECKDRMLTDSEMEQFYHTANIVSRSAYHGYPIHIRFTCPICSGTAEVIRTSPWHGIARCMSCRIVMARGYIGK